MHVYIYVHIYSHRVTFPLKNTIIHNLQPLDNVKLLLNALSVACSWPVAVTAPCSLRPHWAVLSGLHHPPSRNKMLDHGQAAQIHVCTLNGLQLCAWDKGNAKNQPSPSLSLRWASEIFSVITEATQLSTSLSTGPSEGDNFPDCLTVTIPLAYYGWIKRKKNQKAEYLLLNVWYSRDWHQATTRPAFLSPKKAGLILCRTYCQRHSWARSSGDTRLFPKTAHPSKGVSSLQEHSQIQLSLSAVSIKSPGWNLRPSEVWPQL